MFGRAGARVRVQVRAVHAVHVRWVHLKNKGCCGRIRVLVSYTKWNGAMGSPAPLPGPRALSTHHPKATIHGASRCTNIHPSNHHHQHTGTIVYPARSHWARSGEHQQSGRCRDRTFESVRISCVRQIGDRCHGHCTTRTPVAYTTRLPYNPHTRQPLHPKTHPTLSSPVNSGIHG